MRIEQLQQIAEIKKQCSISKAARKLYLAQPSLSTILSGFEQEIGVQLFKRGPSGVTPTKEGEEILDMIDHILRYVDQIVHYQEGHQGLCGEAELLLTKAYQFLIPEILVRFKEIFPQAALNFHVMLPAEVVEEIARGSADIGLTLWDMVPGGGPEALKKRCIAFETFGAHKMMLYTHPGNPLAQQECVTPAELADVQLVVYEMFYWDLFNECVPLSKPALVVDDSENLKYLISQGHAVAVMPEIVAQRDLFLKNDLIVQVPMAGEGVFGKGTEYLLYPAERKLSQLETGVVQILRQLLSCECTGLRFQ